MTPLRRNQLLLLALAILASTQQVWGAKHGVIVQTKMGAVKGQTGPFPWEDVRSWKGIPYAQPPVNTLRFRSPRPFDAPWNATREALQFGDDCPQTSTGMSDRPESEDCLYLNIWSPVEFEQGKLLPVMVFLYGGSWQFGSDSFPIYNGQNIINHGGKSVVIVTLNYRLGALGFLGHGSLAKLSADGSTGNMGIQDQRLALTWVQENIAAFGGDPNNVMLFGESAGAGSTTNHLLMKRSAGLFRHALMESGPVAHWTAKSMDLVEAQATRVITYVGCDPTASPQALLTCLQGASVQSLLHAPASTLGYLLDWSPCVDGVELTALPRSLAENGLFQGASEGTNVILGSNMNEGTQFIGDMCNGMNCTDAEYRTWLVKRFLNVTLADAIYGQYPSRDFVDHSGASASWWAGSSVFTDAEMVCPTRRTARYLAKAPGKHSVYLYHFTHVVDMVKIYKPSLGVFHGSELIFVWDMKFWPYEGFDIPLPLSFDERTLQQVFVDYWTNFATTGNPNFPKTAGLIQWPQYDPISDLNIELDLTLSTNSHLNSERCDFWDTAWPPINQ